MDKIGKLAMEQNIVILQKNIEDIANQMCLAVKGDFDFLINIQTQDENIQKLTMLVNFLLDNARRALTGVKEKNLQLTELDRLKSDFMANISHELRTPLTLIMGPLETALKNSAQYDTETQENLQRMQRNALRLYSLVNDLLDFTKLEVGKFALYEEFIDVAQIIAQLVDDAQGLAKERQVILQFSQENTIGLLQFDQKIIEKIVLNLISNALKFTPKGGKIQVKLAKENDKLRLTISDTGIGIPAEEISHIFERFHQVDSSSTRAYEGTGIGLALIYQFIRLMEGEITVESQEKKGTTFNILLPAHAPTNKADIETSIPTHEHKLGDLLHAIVPLAVATDSQPEIKGKLPLLLVAEDNLDMQAYIVSFLQHSFEIITANNGQLALEMVNKYNPKVVLSDVMMPLMDGYQLTRAMKANLSTRNIPIILITAKTGSNVIAESLNAGADDYLAKPFSPEELIARTNAALTQYENYKKNVELNDQVITLARRAGMADIATFVLHNIGNILNSVNVIVGLLKESTEKPLFSNLSAIANLLKENKDHLATYLSEDEKGKLIPDYLIELTKEINNERGRNEQELQRLNEFIQHIGEIVAAQQSISGVSGVSEKIFLPDLIHKAIEMYKSTTEKRDIQIENQFNCNIFLNTDKSKLLQILVNLLQNATDSLSLRHELPEKRIVIKNNQQLNSHVEIIISDNGVGILPEDLTKIFSFGFTTKQHGHGFGLHSSALAAKELGGSLHAQSEGKGKGADFILTLPLQS